MSLFGLSDSPLIITSYLFCDIGSFESNFFCYCMFHNQKEYSIYYPYGYGS